MPTQMILLLTCTTSSSGIPGPLLTYKLGGGQMPPSPLSCPPPPLSKFLPTQVKSLFEGFNSLNFNKISILNQLE